MVITIGRHLVPVPLAETMFARAMIAQAGQEFTDGSIVLAEAIDVGDGAVTVRSTCYGRTADLALVQYRERLLLLGLDGADVQRDGTAFDLSAHLTWTNPSPILTLPCRPNVIARLGAAITSALIAGAVSRVLDITVAFANERRQFGQAIGQFQAIQQQISVMAEHAAAAMMGARMAFSGGSREPAPYLVAAAKFTASEAVRVVVPIAHAVHGAMGISEDYDLQLFTRRLNAWRMAFGSESAWAAILGAARLADNSASTAHVVSSHFTSQQEN